MAMLPVSVDYEVGGRKFRTVKFDGLEDSAVVPLRESFTGVDFRCVQFHLPTFGATINIMGSVVPTPFSEQFFSAPFRELFVRVQSGDGPKILDLDRMPIFSEFPESESEDPGLIPVGLDCFSEIHMVLGVIPPANTKFHLTLAEKHKAS